MRLALSTLIVISTMVVILSHSSGQAADGNDPVVVAARARQESVKSLNIKFKWKEIVAKGGKTRLIEDIRHKTTGPIPAKETTIVSENTFVVDGEKIRFQRNHPTWDTDGNLVEKNFIGVFNGFIAKNYFPDGMGMRAASQGIIRKEARLEDTKWFVLNPITLTFCGLNPAITAYSISDMNPTGAKLPIDGTMCVEYAAKPSVDSIISCWVDPEKDHVIRRIRKQRQGRLLDQADIRFRPNSNGAFKWVPESWTRTEYSQAGTVLSTSSVEVLELHLNEPQPTELFEIQFPPGCEVYDQRTNKEYKIQADGTMREVSPRTGEELPGSIPQPGELWYWRNKWLLASIGVALVVLVIAYATRRGYWKAHR